MRWGQGSIGLLASPHRFGGGRLGSRMAGDRRALRLTAKSTGDVSRKNVPYPPRWRFISPIRDRTHSTPIMKPYDPFVREQNRRDLSRTNHSQAEKTKDEHRRSRQTGFLRRLGVRTPVNQRFKVRFVMDKHRRTGIDHRQPLGSRLPAELRACHEPQVRPDPPGRPITPWAGIFNKYTGHVRRRAHKGRGGGRHGLLTTLYVSVWAVASLARPSSEQGEKG